VGSATCGEEGKLLLKGGTNAGSLVADADEADENVTGNSPITLQPSSGSDDTDATVTGTGIVLKSDTADATSTAVPLGTVGGGTTAGTNEATITAPSTANNLAIANGWKVKTTTT
jgi:hypothetical protein